MSPAERAELATMSGAKDETARTYKVWDAPTRCFHWINFACVTLLLVSGVLFMYRKDLGIVGTEPKYAIMTVHAWIGYVFAGNLLARIIWGFFGNRHARWRSILPGLQTLRAAVREIRSLSESRAVDETGRRRAGRMTRAFRIGLGVIQAGVGRGPVSRVTVTVTFIFLLMQAATGLTNAGTQLEYPPVWQIYAYLVAKPGVEPSTITRDNAKELTDSYRAAVVGKVAWIFARIHNYGAYVLFAMIVFHLIGVTLSEVRRNSGVVSAMISGRITLDPRSASARGVDRDVRP